MDVDPLASMRCWSVEVDLGGQAYTVPALPAADWWPVFAAPDVNLILDMFVSTLGDETPEDRLLAGEFTAADLRDSLTDAAEEVAGRSLHAAFVLCAVAAAQWPVVNGHLAQRGFRWDVMPIGAALDAIYAIVVGNLGEEDRKKFLSVLENEGVTKGKPSARQRAKVTAEFEAMAGPRPTPVARSSAEPSGSEPPRTPTQPRQPRQGGRSGGPKPRP